MVDADVKAAMALEKVVCPAAQLSQSAKRKVFVY